jgi:hypothetical protein
MTAQSLAMTAQLLAMTAQSLAISTPQPAIAPRQSPAAGGFIQPQRDSTPTGRFIGSPRPSRGVDSELWIVDSRKRAIPPPTAHCPLPTARCPLPAAHWSSTRRHRDTESEINRR